MSEVRLVDVIEVRNILGEGILWNPEDESVWWTDIQARQLYRLDWAHRSIESFATPERLCAFAFTGADDCIVAAFETGFALFHYRRRQTEWIQRLLAPGTGLRFNDGRIDRQGRFWAGTMVEDGRDTPDGRLFRLDADGTVTQMRDDIFISNGTCWSPDASRFYFADSVRRTIYTYAFDASSAGISDPEVFVTTEDGVFPDGATVDAEGCMWSAQWRGGRVVRYTPEGSVAAVAALPVSQPTCAAFGGPDMNLLFVTSARETLDAAALSNEPQAGSVFVLETPHKGIAEARFAIS